MTRNQINPSSSSSTLTSHYLHQPQEEHEQTQGEYLEAVKRMHAKQDAWSRAARSASDSTPSESGSGSRSPSRPTEGLHMTSSFASGSAGGVEGSRVVEKKGRKKVAKACLACQKSHVTCDDKRPCTRCVKKGIGQQCTEGVRKKAKYLLEEDEKSLEAAPQTSSSSTSLLAQHARRHEQSVSISPHHSTHQSVPDYSHFQHHQQQQPSQVSNLPPSLQHQHIQGRPDDIWLAPPLEGDNGIGLSGVDNRLWFGNSGGMNMGDGMSNTGFNNNGMTAATSEYAMLDSMFAMDPVFPGLGNLDNLDQPMSLDQQFIPNWDTSNNNGDTNHTQNIQSQSHPVHPTFLPTTSQTQLPNQQSTDDILTTPVSGLDPGTPWSTWLQGTLQGQQVPAPVEEGLGAGKKTMSSSEVYKKVVKPYDYTEGYHALMEYLTENFERKEILRVVHSLASYRPSLIALQMPMSEEDEVFLEKSFQRTLIELEKLISYSATPTAVWRRTGEVCYANPEFCSLVKRNEGDLLQGQGTGQGGGRKQYIYQLFSKPSIIAYWENFSVHAFENTTQNFFQPTSLLVGDGKVDCSCCYTIRRDVFDLPSVVIGQFLPVPAE